MDTLISIKVFRLVAELKSFAAAGERLGMSTTMVSNHVAHLERRVAARLLNRTTRHVSLSEMGALYFEQSGQMLNILDDVEAVVSKASVVPQGVLKLSAPVSMANPAFAGLLSDYRARYPQVRFDLDLSGRLVNLAEEGFDLALRLTHSPSHPGLIERPLAKIRFNLFAAPSYLDRHGRPETAEALDGHHLLLYPLATLNSTHSFKGKTGTHTIRFVPVLESANDTILHLAAIEGMGMVFFPQYLVSQDLAAKRLEMVLPELATFEHTLYGVYPSRKYLSAKVRTFLEFMAEDARFA